MGIAALKPAVFLDRDGVINEPRLEDGQSLPPRTPAEYKLVPGVVEACAELRKAGYALVVVTNQPDVARGAATRDGVEAINDLVRRDLPVDEVVTCFHDEADRCGCRKPKPGMLTAAAERRGLALERSWMVGDRWSDVEAGRAAGCRTVLVVTPFSRPERCRPDGKAADLRGAARIILEARS